MKILAFGEILWDVFEKTKEIGGAPFNFCAHLSKLGGESYLLSSVGDDDLAGETLAQMDRFNVKRPFVFKSSLYPTGVCRVSCDSNGQPTYDLGGDMAYDHITLDDETLKDIKAHAFDAFYFGTLAQRSPESRQALNRVLQACSFRDVYCDLNIRQHYHNRETIETCLSHATMLKLNRDECSLLMSYMDIAMDKSLYASDEDFYREFGARLCKTLGFKLVIITLDADGALVYESAKQTLCASGRPLNKAVSTVGAGDSFSACFLYNYLNGEATEQCLKRANLLGDYVVTRYGAVPDYSEALLARIK